jgi:hypothetical protein
MELDGPVGLGDLVKAKEIYYRGKRDLLYR